MPGVIQHLSHQTGQRIADAEVYGGAFIHLQGGWGREEKRRPGNVRNRNLVFTAGHIGEPVRTICAGQCAPAIIQHNLHFGHRPHARFESFLGLVVPKDVSSNGPMPFGNDEIGYVLELVSPANEANRRVLPGASGILHSKNRTSQRNVIRARDALRVGNGVCDVFRTPLERAIIVEQETVTQLFPMFAPARPVRGPANLGAHGNQVDGGPFDIPGRDQERAAGQELVHLLNGGRLDPQQIQTLLQSRHLPEDETQSGGVGIAFRVAVEREGAPTRLQGSAELLAAAVEPGSHGKLVLSAGPEMLRLESEAGR